MKEAVLLFLQVHLKSFIILEHTDPSIDYFEEGYELKYKAKYKQFLTVRTNN